jgi:hypothetical protein
MAESVDAERASRLVASDDFVQESRRWRACGGRRRGDTL